MSLTPGTKLGPYEILAPLGAGGMGEVYKAKDTRLDRTVAIKVLPSHVASHPEVRQRFEREARAVSSLNHPNICTLHDIGSENGIDFMVMEHIEGDTLADRLKKGALPLDQALRYGIEIADALDKAHRQGVVHRDLKPGNIMLTKSGAKLLDFGLAKMTAAETNADGVSALPTEAKPLTQEGSILGTFQYMAPEQLEGKEADARTDLFAFGSVLYEMVTGKKAFEGKSQASLISAIMKDQPPTMSTFQTLAPSALDRLVTKCLAKEPDGRWQTARDLHDELTWISEGGSRPAATASRRRHSRSTLAWSVAALMTVVAAVFLFSNRSPSNERVLRYSVPLPQGLTFSYALSPDGRHVAFYSATGVGERSRIFVRSLDSWDLQPLPSTLGNTGLLWSPDSRYIAFFAREKLWKVAVNGGPAEELCDVLGLLGARGTWGREDVIVFAPSSTFDEPGPLRSVPATGGDSRPLTAAAPGESHRFPVFLPDGNHFLYTSVGGSNPGIYVASLDEPAGRRLLADESSAHVASAPNARAASHLLFIRDGDLIAQEFDTDELELRGEPFLLLADAPRQVDGAAAVSVSEDGILSYLGGRNRETDSRFTWFDRTGKVLSQASDFGPPSFASLSPDERTMAVPLTPPESRTTDLFFRDLTRGVDERFTFDKVDDWNAVWSSDGSKLLFSANPRGTVDDIFWKDTRSSRPVEVLLTTENPKYVADWSRDGRYVLYTELDPETQADLWYLPMENGGTAGDVQPTAPVPFLQTEFLESAAQISPDGKWIAYTSDESGTIELYVRSFPSGEGKRRISTGWAMQPRWSPDGGELFFFSGSLSISTLMSATVTSAIQASPDGQPIFETEEPEPLFQVRVNVFDPAFGTFFYSVSADGQRFLINHVDKAEEPILNVIVNWHQAFGVSQER